MPVGITPTVEQTGEPIWRAERRTKGGHGHDFEHFIDRESEESVGRQEGGEDAGGAETVTL